MTLSLPAVIFFSARGTRKKMKEGGKLRALGIIFYAWDYNESPAAPRRLLGRPREILCGNEKFLDKKEKLFGRV